MERRPYVLLSCAVSADGYLDDAAAARLILSSEADADRVDDVRASVDAILVGANTIRRDNPRLLVRSEARQAARAVRGLPASPVKVTVTATGNLDPAARFFTAGTAGTLVYCAAPAVAAARARLGTATVVDAGERLSLSAVLADLFSRGVRRLMVEGGASVLTQFLSGGLADELQLAVAPFFVGDPAAPRFAAPARYPHDAGNRMTLAEVRRLGDVVLLRYLLGPPGADRRWLREAIELSRRCLPSPRAYSVGAVIVDAGGELLATGYSREHDSHDHAEEVALRKVSARGGTAGRRLVGATLYSSLEPCSTRASRPRPCAELIVESGIRRVAFAWREPGLFADCTGAEMLSAAGASVIEMPELAGKVRAVNAHLFG